VFEELIGLIYIGSRYFYFLFVWTK